MFAKSKVSLPEVACFLSHIGVWQKIAAGSAPAAFVFEDDFHLEPGAAQAMSLLSAARPTWDMLKLFAGKERSTLGTVHTCGGHRIEIPTVLPSTTVAYAITRSAARELADRSFPVRRPVDLYLKHWWEHQALIKVIQPSLVTQSESHLATSSIDAARGEARSGNLMSRLFRNLGYQAAFRFNMMLHARSRRLDAAWPMEEQLRAPVTRREVRQAAAS